MDMTSPLYVILIYLVQRTHALLLIKIRIAEISTISLLLKSHRVTSARHSEVIEISLREGCGRNY
jgi:hypothetical protein